MASLPQLYSDSKVQRELLATIAFGPNKIPKGFFAGLLEVNNSNELEEPAGILLEPNVVVASNSRWPMQEMYSDDDFEPDRPCHSRPSKASEQLVEKYVDVFRGMMVHSNQDTDEALRKAIARMEKLSNANSVNTALHTFASECSMKRSGGRGKIPVQPTSRARRRAGLPRGAATVGKGRPPSSLPPKKPKRKRNLAENVLLNVANAKSH